MSFAASPMTSRARATYSSHTSPPSVQRIIRRAVPDKISAPEPPWIALLAKLTSSAFREKALKSRGSSKLRSCLGDEGRAPLLVALLPPEAARDDVMLAVLFQRDEVFPIADFGLAFGGQALQQSGLTGAGESPDEAELGACVID